ncbi:DUF3592 domain-containing protein [Stieleria sp. ICT_E10.1]|uniref:DUF3592 domain-containing protein n=1 Tax=Stieleria sedimenti TaxID=2976331 RepID=UPI00217FB9AA|nr:DUF3592 domain-containing protein [Stieleria sedimenti]MCS7470574.1 DUF3592 domain-containing protein [Stieleria sedimenti]
MSHTTEASATKPILWCLIFVGAWLAVSGLASFLVQWKASKWPTVEGSIRRAEVVPENDYYFVRLEYEFTVDGVAYTSDDVYLNSGIGGISVASETMGAETQASAERLRENYPVGKPVKVYYQPQNPSRSALVIETTGMLVIGVFGLILATIAFLPLKFPKLFQSTRERIDSDERDRWDRVPVVYTTAVFDQLQQECAEQDQTPPFHPGSILDSPEIELVHWQPGQRVEFKRCDGGLLSRTPVYLVCIDWQPQTLVIGNEGETESIPFSEVNELRLGGLRERRSSGGKHSQRYEAWDVWLDVIVGARRIRLASQGDYRDPDRAFCQGLRPAALLAVSLGRQLRWVGFDGHGTYRPPRFVPGIESADLERHDSAAAARGSDETRDAVSSDDDTPRDPSLTVAQQEWKPISKPPKTRISMQRSDDFLHVALPRQFRSSDLQGFGAAVLVGGFAAMIAPAAFRDPEPGPRIFVGVLCLIPLTVLIHAITQWAKSGVIDVTGNRLTVTTRGLLRSKRRQWSIGDLLTVSVVPCGEERGGLPIEELAVISVDGTYQRYFKRFSNRELAWIATSIRQFLSFPEPPAITQSDPDKAVLEISRGLAQSQQKVMEDALQEMKRQSRRVHEGLEQRDTILQTDDVETVMPQIADEIVERMERAARSRTDAVRAEFGLIDFEVWDPGNLIRYRNTTLDPKANLIHALISGVGYAFVLLFVVPFAIPILGAIALIPIDLMGSRRWHFVVTDMMAFGGGLLYWIITLTLLTVAWTYLKLAAAFAPREIELDWNQRRLTIRDSRGEQSYSFQEIRRLNLREARRPSAKQKDSLFRLEAQLPGRSVILLEADEADEIVGLAETEMPSQQRVRLLAEELAPHLGVAIDLAEPVTDRFNAVGYPGEAHLTDMVRLWRIVDGRTKRRISLAIAAILLFWIFRIVRSYQANADVG